MPSDLSLLGEKALFRNPKSLGVRYFFFFLMVSAKHKGLGDFLHKRQRYLTAYMVTEHEVLCPVCCDFNSVFNFHLNHFWT